MTIKSEYLHVIFGQQWFRVFSLMSLVLIRKSISNHDDAIAMTMILEFSQLTKL
ncbi:hypothetical protein Sbal625DRAFT_4133 [Shewanella baltica OS625]|nr:hypothetical protein Sbal625DRAFT_4133 [Shewanella baltica OS625]